MIAGRALKWIERTLFAVGAVFAVWCAVALLEARYYAHLPVPPPSRSASPPAASTPGDSVVVSTETPRRKTASEGDFVAKLDAPTVHLSATVLEGSSDAVLAKASGHIEDTAFPGEPGNVGIAGHRDTTFRAVRNLRIGDPLIVTTSDATYRYRITKLRIVMPEDVSVLDPADHATLTLVTCYPFAYIGHAPKRFIVSADFVAQEPR